MAEPRAFREFLVNGSTGDPALFIDFPGRDDALLFDAGENATLGQKQLGDLDAVFLTHHHVDHFIGFDRVVRANLDRDKALHVVGPEGTIRKIYDRIKSYEYPYFPFQKIVLDIAEVIDGRLRSARLECSKRFPRPQVHEYDRDGPVVHETRDVRVEAVHVDHTVPCLAFAMVEKPGIVPDPDRIDAGPLLGGPWIGQALKLLRAGGAPETPLMIRDESYPLGELRERYFEDRPGARVAYVTDTAWSESARPGLLRLALGAKRLYCDSFYAQAQILLAEKHHHMTATQAAEFAREAGVGELVLIHFSARYEGRFEALIEEARSIFPAVSAEIPARSAKKSPPGPNPS